MLGKSYKVNTTNNLLGLIAKLFNVSPLSHEIFKFDWITLSNEIIHAQSYQRVTRHDSSVISYIDRSSIKYGCVKQFYMYKETNNNYYFALMEEFHAIHKIDSSHIMIISSESSKEDKLVKVGDFAIKWYILITIKQNQNTCAICETILKFVEIWKIILVRS